jgi:hypothetical protein
VALSEGHRKQGTHALVVGSSATGKLSRNRFQEVGENGRNNNHESVGVIDDTALGNSFWMAALMV